MMRQNFAPATVLVEEIHEGAIRVGALQHSDLGLGDCEDFDGEMVIVDGRCYRVRCDGVVRECEQDVISPFALVTRFTADKTVTLDNCPDMAHLISHFDSLRTSDTLLFALRVDGYFEYVHTRALCRPVGRFPADHIQPDFKLYNIPGTLVGFWSPSHATTLNTAGYHLHFLSHDHESGGHLLQCRGTNLRLQIQRLGYL